MVRDSSLLFRIFGANGMYSRCNDNTHSKWVRYRISNVEDCVLTAEKKQWIHVRNEYGNIIYEEYICEANEEGDIIYYIDSHYEAANITNERRYLLEIEGSNYIPAVRRGDKYLNLISMEEFVYATDMSYKVCPSTPLGALPYRSIDL